jgi:hypothetical protein
MRAELERHFLQNPNLDSPEKDSAIIQHKHHRSIGNMECVALPSHDLANIEVAPIEQGTPARFV